MNIVRISTCSPAWALVVLACSPSSSTTSDGTTDDATTVADATATDDAMNDATGTNDATATPDSGGATSGQTGDETGLPPNACPADADLIGECPSQGDTCVAGDFDCGCVCACDEGGASPGEPGFWQCSYTRKAELVEPLQATVTVDCGAGTIASTVSLMLDNVDGQQPVTITMSDVPDYRLIPEGGDTDTSCGGFCGPGQTCRDVLSVTLEPGDSQPLNHAFGPAACPDDVDLCSFCNGTASFWTVLGFAAGELGDGILQEFDAIPVTCR